MIWLYLAVIACGLLASILTGEFLVLLATGLWLLPALLWTFLPPPACKRGRAL